MKIYIKKMLMLFKLYSISIKLYDNILYLKALLEIKFFHKKLNVKIMSIEETLYYILDKKCSVVRFGDGEFAYISGKNIGYQKFDIILSDNLKKIFLNKNKNILICIHQEYIKRDNLTYDAYKYWTYAFNRDFNLLKGILNEKYFYGNTDISRPYIVFKNKDKSYLYFNLLKKIWNNKDILLVEGDLTRTGVGNDLLDNCRNVYRIICPSKNCFSVYNDIKYKIILFLNKYIEKYNIKNNILIMIALGPVAKSLVYDLSNDGYILIDIGHVDSEYEWYLKKTNYKEKIKGKHTAEHEDVNIDICSDKKYLNQIVDVIK